MVNCVTNMVGGICCIVGGLGLLGLGVLGIHSLSHTPVERYGSIEKLFVLGLVFLAIGILSVIYRSHRHAAPTGISAGAGYGDDCGHAGGCFGHGDGDGGDC
jgi:hypothetical protein